MLTNEQVIAAQKAQLEAFHELTTHYVSSVGKLTELNLRLAKDCLQDSATNANNMLDSMVGQPASSLQNSVPEPLLPRLTDYFSHLFDLASSMGHEFTEMLSSHAEKANKQLIENVDDALKNVPVGSEPVTKAVKEVVENGKPSGEVIRDAFQKSSKTD